MGWILAISYLDAGLLVCLLDVHFGMMTRPAEPTTTSPKYAAPIGRNKSLQDWSDPAASRPLIGRPVGCDWPGNADFEPTSPFEWLRSESQDG